MWSGFSPSTMHNLWQMLAYLNGQVLNYSTLGSSLGVSHTTIRNYIDLLESSFMLRLLPSFVAGSLKRLVKSPKLYFTDIGIANALLRIQDFEQLSGHPSMGAAWETVVLNTLTSGFPQGEFFYYRTMHGAEIDIVMIVNGKCVAIECKASLSPKLGKGNYNAISDLQPVTTLVISPVEKGWSLQEKIQVVNLVEATGYLSALS